MRSSAPTMSAPAASASPRRVPGGEHGDPDRLAGPVGQRHGAAHHLVGLAGVDAEPEGDFDGLVELGGGERLHELHRLGGGQRAALGRTAGRRWRTPCRAWSWLVLLGLPRVDGGPAARSSAEPVVLIRQSTTSMPMDRAVPAIWAIAPSRSIALRSGRLVSAIWRTCAFVTCPTFSRRGFSDALLDAGGLAQQEGGRRRLGHEGERAVLVHRDLGGDHLAALVLGGRVVRLAELHDVDAVWPERGADGRGRGRLPGRDLDLDHGGKSFLCH